MPGIALGINSRLVALGASKSLAPRKLDLNLVVENMRSMLGRLVGGNIELKVVPLVVSGGILRADSINWNRW